MAQLSNFYYWMIRKTHSHFPVPSRSCSWAVANVTLQYSHSLSLTFRVSRGQAGEWHHVLWHCGDPPWRHMGKTLPVPLEFESCQCSLPSAELWLCKINPDGRRFCGWKWAYMERCFSLWRDRVLPVGLCSSDFGQSNLFSQRSSHCNLLRWVRSGLLWVVQLQTKAVLVISLTASSLWGGEAFLASHCRPLCSQKTNKALTGTVS